MGVELFHVDGRTDMTALIVGFHNYAKAPKKRNKHSAKSFGFVTATHAY